MGLLTRFASVWALVVLSVPLWAADVPVTTYTSGPKIWTLQNSAMRAQFQLLNGVFQLLFFSSTDGTVKVLPPVGVPVTPIQLEMDGSPIDPSTVWTFVKTSQTATERGGVLRNITVANAKLALQIGVNLEIHPDQPFIHYWLTVNNQSTLPHVITSVNLMNWSWQSGSQNTRAFFLNQYRAGGPFLFNPNDVDLTTQKSGVTVFSGAHGDHIGYMALVNPAGGGIVAGWEFDGRAHITAQQSGGSAPVQLTGGPDELRITVAPQQTQTLPASFVGLFHGDWDEAGYRTQRYTEAVLAQSLPDNNFPYVMFDTWGYIESFNDASLRNMVDRAASIGVEVFVLDLGWTRSVGDWRYNTSKFPLGLKDFSDYVHAKGMKLGLHWTPAEAATTSPVMTAHSEYQATEPVQYYGSLPLCLGNTPGQLWARGMIEEMVTNYNFDWVTQDGENLVKLCTRTDHTHDPANSNYDNSVNGIDSLVSTMRTRHPDLLWENNADGGDMLTFQMVKNYVTAASCDACAEDLRLQAVYGMSYAFSPRYIDRYLPGNPTKWNMRTAGFGGPLIIMQKINGWTEVQTTLMANEVKIYKSLRNLIRDGKTYHLGPFPGFTYNSMIESYNAAMDRAVIFAYRPESTQNTLLVQPRGLNPTGMYNVRLEDAGTTWIASGAALMAQGFTVKLAAQDTAEIIYIEPVTVTP